MSTTLKLTGLKTFMSALMFNVNLRRDDVVRVSDDVAGRIGGMHRMSDQDAIKVFYFTAPGKGEKVTYDFTHSTVAEAAATRGGESDYMARVAKDAAEYPNGRSVVAPEPASVPEPSQPVQEEPVVDRIPPAFLPTGDESSAPAEGKTDAPAEDPQPAADTTSEVVAAPAQVARKRAAQRAQR